MAPHRRSVQDLLSSVCADTVFNNSENRCGTIIDDVFEIGGSEAANFNIFFFYTKVHHTFNSLEDKTNYCAFDILQKDIFCLTFYSK